MPPSGAGPPRMGSSTLDGITSTIGTPNREAFGTRRSTSAPGPCEQTLRIVQRDPLKPIQFAGRRTPQLNSRIDMIFFECDQISQFGNCIDDCVISSKGVFEAGRKASNGRYDWAIGSLRCLHRPAGLSRLTDCPATSAISSPFLPPCPNRSNSTPVASSQAVPRHGRGLGAVRRNRAAGH